METRNSVLMHVNRRIEESQESIMRKENVSCAGNDLQPINIRTKKHVRDPAQQSSLEFVKVKAVRRRKIEPVFNLEVENHHNFEANGGFIVHNCLDAMRYAMERFGRKGSGIQFLT